MELIIGLILIAPIVFIAIIVSERKKKTVKTSDNATLKKENTALEHDYADEQLRILENANLKWQPVLYDREAEVFRLVEKVVSNGNKSDLRVLAQVNLGEIIKTTFTGSNTWYQNKVYRAYGSKRIDILVVDHYFWPRLAIEYQGKNHHKGNSFKRDEVKRRVLSKAKIRLIEVYSSDSDQDIEGKIQDWLTAFRVHQKNKKASK